MSSVPISEALYIEQDGNQFNDLWLACAVIFGVIFGFFLGVFVLFVIRRHFPAKYTKADSQRLAESGLQAEVREEARQEEDNYSEIVPPGEGTAQTVLTTDIKKPLSWVRRHSTVDLGEEATADGVIDALAQDTCVQMQLALVSQEFRTVLHWEEELQGQYRITFLNLINIYLDSLVQQKIILEEGKKEISDAFSGELKSKALEWKDMISEATKEYERRTGDALQAPHIEELRYQASMEMETLMLKIRENLRNNLVEKTQLKTEEIDFMEEKLIENLTLLCEIINIDYNSVSKIQSDRFSVVRKVAGLQYASSAFEPEEANTLSEKFSTLIADLKKNHKLGGSVASKVQKTFDERIADINIKYDNEFNQNLTDQLEKCAKDRIAEQRRIKSWKRSTEIASTSNQSYQAAVDGLIEPSRYVQTIHELQKTVRLDKMLAVKRVDAKEGEIFEKLVKERIEGKTKEYQEILSDAMGTMKLEKNMESNMLDQKSKAFRDEMKKLRESKVTELQKDIDEDIRIHETVKDKLDREMRRQSADQEELLGEQEDAVREVLQTQSGLTEIDREQMMAIHQHQALAVINMLFMNRLRAMKRIEVTRLQNKDEMKEYDNTNKAEASAAIGPAGKKPPTKKQIKMKEALEGRHASARGEKVKDMVLSADDAVNKLRQYIFEVTSKTLQQFDERMGELLARLQVIHAGQEGSRVKTAQVLNKIKTKLVDAIWMDGYVSEAACKKTLQDHHKIVQDVTDKLSVKRTTNIQQVEKVADDRQMKREDELKKEVDELVEEYKKKESSKFEMTEPLWDNWSKSRKQIDIHNSSMELSRQIQDLYTSIEDESASQLKDEEINIILELVRMGRMDINDFDKTIRTSVTACVGGEKLYKELSAPLLERYGQTVKRADKAMNYWQVANEQMAPPLDPKLAAERAAEVWRSRLGIYDNK